MAAVIPSTVNLNAGLVYYVTYYVRCFISSVAKFLLLYPARFLHWDEYYSYILTVSMLLLGNHLLSHEVCTLYANLCIISIFHTTRYCVKKSESLTPSKSRIHFVYISYSVAIYTLFMLITS